MVCQSQRKVIEVNNYQRDVRRFLIPSGNNATVIQQNHSGGEGGGGRWGGGCILPCPVENSHEKITYILCHSAKLPIAENNCLTIGEQYDTIQNLYTLLLIEFSHICS